MSTVIYKDNTLLADSLVTIKDTVVSTPPVKIFKSPSFLFGGVGNVADIHSVYRWLTGHISKFPQVSSFIGIVVTMNQGVFILNDDKTFIEHDYSDTVCIGSGSIVAETLFECTELSPQEVMDMVKCKDINTGGETIMYHTSEITKYDNIYKIFNRD